MVATSMQKTARRICKCSPADTNTQFLQISAKKFEITEIILIEETHYTQYTKFKFEQKKQFQIQI